MSVFLFAGLKIYSLIDSHIVRMHGDDFRENYLYGCYELTQFINIVVLTTRHFGIRCNYI